MDGNYYNIISGNNGYDGYYVKNSIQKAETQGDYVYLYDKFVLVRELDAGGMYVYNTQDIDEDEESEIIFSCLDESNKIKTVCQKDDSENYDSEKTADYVFENIDKLNIYKHTFKKGTDGEYYWVSSEIVVE